MFSSLFLWSLTLVYTVSAWDCKAITVNDKTYNLGDLPKVSEGMSFNLTYEVSKAVSKNSVSLLGNVCGPLKNTLGSDGCSDDTWVCLVTTNWKAGAARVTDKVAIAEKTVPKASVNADNKLVLELGNVTIRYTCKKDSPSNVYTLVSHTATNFEVSIESDKACAIPKGSIGNGGSSSMSGTGIFFLTLFIFAIVYFVLGSAYNYSVLRMTSFPDFIPHIDFWSRLFSGVIDFVFVIMERLRGTGSSSNYVRI